MSVFRGAVDDRILSIIGVYLDLSYDHGKADLYEELYHENK